MRGLISFVNFSFHSVCAVGNNKTQLEQAMARRVPSGMLVGKRREITYIDARSNDPNNVSSIR